MKRTIYALALCALPFCSTVLLSGCVTHYEQPYLGSDDFELARVPSADGTVEVFTLEDARALRVRVEGERERPFLGLKVVQLDKVHADQRGVDPFSGLLVTGTYADSSARLGGVLTHDVLLSIDEQPVVYLEQLTAAEASLRDGQAVRVRVLRGQEERDVVLSAKMLRESITDTQTIALVQPSPGPRPYAGVELRGIPSSWCERMFGEAREAVVVSGVTIGSPAWLAGFRGGDVIERVDGQPVPTVEELARRIADQGRAGQSMRWQVRREAGAEYEAEVQLDDFSGELHVGIPLLVGVRSSPSEDRWSVLLGLLAGNRNEYVANNRSREVETRNVFSALLGLVKVDSRPHSTHVRLLWFIRWEI